MIMYCKPHLDLRVKLDWDQHSYTNSLCVHQPRWHTGFREREREKNIEKKTVPHQNEYMLYFLSPVAAEPDLSRLVVSNITSDRFTLSWRTGEKAFDNFIVEVRESALPSQAMGRSLPGGVRSTVMVGLKGAPPTTLNCSPALVARIRSPYSL